jgi:CSLREA domain-containing protein
MTEIFIRLSLSKLANLAVVLIVSSCFSGIAYAASFTVSNTSDTGPGSLRQAIAAANANGTEDIISFDPAIFSTSQTITLTSGELVVQTDISMLTIIGPGRDLLTISGNNSSRVFNVHLGSKLRLQATTVKNGKLEGFSNGAGIYNEGVLSMDDCVLANNEAGMGNGGGIFSEGDQASVTLNNSMVTGNGGNGAGMEIHMGMLTITDSTITNNHGINGTGILNAGGTATLSNVTVSHNTAGNGGGIGGGILTSGRLTGNNVTVADNSAENNAGGGGIYNEGELNLSFSRIERNTSLNGDGGGLFTRNGHATLTNVSITNNSACSSCRGGGISNWQNSSVLDVTDSTISGNSSGSAGGVFNENGATTNLTRVTISNNVALNGGGLYVSSGAVNCNNTTISNNTASGAGGGGGAIVGSADFHLTNCTVAYNISSAGGAGGIHNGSGTATGTITLHNTIIADNSSVDAGPDVFGRFVTEGYNLIGNTSGLIITGPVAGDRFDVEARLVPLRENGGLNLTVALHPSSPAVDGGDPAIFPATDQRGIMRPQDGDLDGESRGDIGSYETLQAPVFVTKTDDTNDGICDADCSLREAIAVTKTATTPDNAILFSQPVFQSPQTITLGGSELEIRHPGTLLIKGPGAGLLTLSGHDQSRVFSVRTISNVAIEMVTLTHGNGAGAVNTTFGGVVYSDAVATSVSDAVIMGNSAAKGGGMASFAGNLMLDRCVVSTNAASSGGGFYNLGYLFISDSTVSENAAPGAGGIENHRYLSLEKAIIGRNRGGGITNAQDASAFLNFVTVRNNLPFDSTSGGGRGIENFGLASISRSTIHNNTAGISSPGAGINNTGSLTLADSTISGNTAETGGGIYNTGTVGLTYATIAGNAATGSVTGGGGIINAAPGIVNSINTIIAKNVSINGGTAPDFSGTLNSNGYNLIGNTNGTNIIGTATGNLLGVDPMLDPVLRTNGGVTVSHALLTGSPAIDKGVAVAGVLKDQRGRARRYDFPFVQNADGGDASDIGSFERQATDIDPSSTLFDYDGDGKSDISVFRPSSGAWYLQRSRDGLYGTEFGFGDDKITPADYDGDGRTDIAVYRPSTGLWYVMETSTGNVSYHVFGTAEDLPTPADYDGDGRADISVYRPSTRTWYRQNSSDGSFYARQFGSSQDQPVTGDFDGDGKADLAIFRLANGAWYQLYSSDDSLHGREFGFGSDIIVPADYDGDGKTDIAVYRPSEGYWYISNSSSGEVSYAVFGLATDIPAPGDFDGDGKADISVFRPMDGNWYRRNSSDGSFTAFQFGTTGDRPTQTAFRY